MCVERERACKYGKMLKIVNLNKGCIGVLCIIFAIFLKFEIISK